MATQWPKKRRLLGTKIQRLDGPAKATGKAKYSFDINRPGMLHAQILRCPHGHAKVKSIDTTAARRVPGFKALVLINAAREGTVAEVDAAAGKLVFKYRAGTKEESRTVQAGPGVTV